MTPKKQADPAEKTQNSSKTHGILFTRYDALVQSGHINEDAAQRALVGHLQTLHDRLLKKHPKTGKASLLKGLFKPATEPEKGLYVWGAFGRGKSMLMDMFFEHAPVKKKRRVHFHAFMQDVHIRIHQLRQEGKGDPVALLAQEIAQSTSLLCFDELQATDVADATLLYRLFEGLFAAGVVIVSTSNRPPAKLYTGGVQRERFHKFIELLETHMHVAALSSPSDYRTLKLKDLKTVYFSPLGKEADAFIATILGSLGDTTAKADTFMVQGRKLAFTRYSESIGHFSFSALCEAALGPADYLAIARRLSVVILTDIPRLTPENRNEAKRFVTLIDALYEHKVELICTAAAPPETLYTEGDGAFEFARTVSRLMEMQSSTYLQGNT